MWEETLRGIITTYITTYESVVEWTVIRSHVVIYVLSVVGLLLRPFSRVLWDFSGRRPSSLPASAVVFLYPWIHLWGKPPRDITGTPFRPSRLWLVYTLLVHTLWLISSVGLWVGLTLWSMVAILSELYPDTFGAAIGFDFSQPVPPNISGFQDWMYHAIVAMYVGVFACWSSLVWLRSLIRSRTHFRYMNRMENGVGLDKASHYLTPFRKATKWAFATLPIYIGVLVITLIFYPPMYAG